MSFPDLRCRSEYSGYCWSPRSGRVLIRFCYLVAAVAIAASTSSGTGPPAALIFTAALRFDAGNSSFTPRQSSQFWTSSEGSYTFGFKEVGDHGPNQSYLLAIWRSEDPIKTAIWWAANASSNITSDPVVTRSALFTYTGEGSLQLYSVAPNGSSASAIPQYLVWTSNTRSSFGELQETGNLMLRDVQEQPVWISAQDPRESVMVVEGLDAGMVTNKPAWLRSRRNQTSYAAGKFHLATDAQQKLYFYALDPVSGRDYVYYMDVQMSIAGSSGSLGLTGIFSPFTSNRTATADDAERLSLDYDGNLRAYRWDPNTTSWQEVWQIMTGDKCRWLGSPCGPFGLCRVRQNGAVSCSCPPGYHARDAGDLSQGCSSDIPFDAACSRASSGQYLTTIVELPNTDYDYNDMANHTVVDIDQCKALCLNDCACVAASYRDYDSTCFVKGNATLGHLLNGWSPDSNTLLVKVVIAVADLDVAEAAAKRWLLVVGILVAELASCSATLLLPLLLCRRRRRRARMLRMREEEEYSAAMELTDNGGADPVQRFQYAYLVEATNNFSSPLGEGAFGKVYKGWVRAGTSGNSEKQLQAVAVKVLKQGVGDLQLNAGRGLQRAKQFGAELRTLGKIHHVNLVVLLGYCVGERGAASPGEGQASRRVLILVYEYMEKGSLDRYLDPAAQPEKQAQLPWSLRYSVALGIARGIAYLHHECSPRVVHCDIKPQNVLLAADFCAKVADFGYARRFDHQRHSSHLTISALCGTPGYIAPELLKSCEITSKADVYSFGILLLHLVRGLILYDDCVEWAFRCISAAAAATQHHCYIAAVREDEDASPSIYHDDMDGFLLQEPSAIQAKLQLLRVGLWCVQPLASMRPPMSRIVQLIEGTTPVEDPPHPHVIFLPKPSFFPRETSDPDASAPSSYSTQSTISLVSPR